MVIDENNNMSVLAYNKHLEEDTTRNKKKLAFEFEEMGNQFLNEIDKKKNRKKITQFKLIPYILKHHSNIYDEDELKSYSPEDIQHIYNEIKKEKKSVFIKFFHFLFNIE